jgi:hypothetical protein
VMPPKERSRPLVVAGVQRGGLHQSSIATTRRAERCLEMSLHLHRYATWCVVRLRSSVKRLTRSQLITGKAPYEDKTQQTYYKDVVELKQRRAKPTRQNSLGKISVPAELWDVVYGCWRNRPHMRLNMKQVLACLDIDIDEIYQVHKPPYFSTNVLRSCEYRWTCAEGLLS